MFLMGVGEQTSAELLRQLQPDEIRKISSEISALDAVSPDHMLEVFREFEELSSQSRYFAKGGADCARRFVEQALGPESAQKLLESPAGPLRDTSEMGLLQNTDPEHLAAFLRNENPQTIALVLSNLPAKRAGVTMAALPIEAQPQVALRMASLDRISPEVFRKITEAIGSKLRSVRQVSRSDGIRSLAALLNQMDPATADGILSRAEEENPVVVESLRNMMFVFEDILTIDKEGIKTLLSKIDRKVLTIALKGTSAKIREHFTQCMSQRAAEMLAEDMEALGPVRIRDVQGAQKQLAAVVRQLQQQGIISGRGGAEEYVV